MPIKNLTTEARFPIIGHLRKGAPKPNERQPGRDLDHFRFTADDRSLEALFADVYGEEPQQINVRLPYPSTDENFEAWLEEYTAGAMQRRCNGDVCVLWRDDFGNMSDVEVECQSRTGCGCSETGRLSVVLPELERMAVVVVHTTSVHDIKNLHGALVRYEQVARAGGKDLTGIPFVLRRVPRKISTPGANGKRARREKWLLTIEPLRDWVSLQLAEANRRALTSGLSEDRQLAGGAQRAVIGVQRQLTGGDATAVRELHTAASEYGFRAEDRALRLAFVSLLVGEEVESFKDVGRTQEEYAVDALDHICKEIPDAAERLSFARACAESLTDLSAKRAVARALYYWRQERKGGGESARREIASEFDSRPEPMTQVAYAPADAADWNDGGLFGETGEG